MDICSKCGEQLENEEYFCHNCGMKTSEYDPAKIKAKRKIIFFDSENNFIANNTIVNEKNKYNSKSQSNQQITSNAFSSKGSNNVSSTRRQYDESKQYTSYSNKTSSRTSVSKKPDYASSTRRQYYGNEQYNTYLNKTSFSSDSQEKKKNKKKKYPLDIAWFVSSIFMMIFFRYVDPLPFRIIYLIDCLIVVWLGILKAKKSDKKKADHAAAVISVAVSIFIFVLILIMSFLFATNLL